MHAHPFESRLAHLEGAFIRVNERLGSIDRRMDSFERRLDSSEHQTALRFDQVDRRFNWLTALVIGSWITIMAAQIGTAATVVFHH